MVLLEVRSQHVRVKPPHTAASKVGAYAFIRHFIFVGATACDDSITMMSAIVTDGSVINLKRSHSSHAQKERTLCSHFESSVIIGEKSFNEFLKKNIKTYAKNVLKYSTTI